MFRINLIKLSILLSFFFSHPVLAAVENPKQILDEDGKPIPNATIQVRGAAPVLVDKEGKVTANLPEGESILIFALGYESLQISREDWLAKEVFILKEKSGSLQEVVVAATRTDRTVEDLPLPVTVLNEKAIQETGGIRLSEILREQTGLQIEGDHGAGLQMQGLDSDYILILLDGEPLIGRTAGTFDLDRISVSNIERIEILRGPSSAIYGSEAMAGVVNIITKSTEEETRLDLGLRHRSFNSWNPYADLGFSKGKWSTKLFYDYMRTDGYDLTPEAVGQTQNPYDAHTAQLKINGEIHQNWDLSLFGRAYVENSSGFLETASSSGRELLSLDNSRRDFHFNPTLRFKPNSKILMTLRGMSSWFSTVSDTRFESDGQAFDFQDFNQFYHRTEFQTDYQIKENQLLTLGMGHLIETVEATRYDENNRFDAGYLFLQHQWDPGTKTNIISGFRADRHSEYASRISPKISGQYRFSENFSWQASLGAGFKAPDFRQLLLNFNNAAAGYYVFGSTLAQEGIEKLQNEGLVARILLDPATLGDLKAESSWALNTGLRWKLNPRLMWVANAYRNHINDLIETAPIAQLVTGQNAFSYFNISQVVTQGIETDLSFQATSNLQLSLGYAFLDTQDATVLDQIDAGEIFKRDDQNRTSRVVRSDYGGLFNRSRHSGNIKVNYRENRTGIDLAVRAIFRGKFGFADLNGNLILDDESEYAPGWMSLNLTASKTLENGVFLEVGGTNLNNTQTTFQPTNPGRVLFAGLKIPFANFIQTK
ncbi:TonB-dependent receptor [Algoriphagus boritolerans]|uniref:Outer membrane receptor for ferrienterochelin and colicins n=1 Tax=Algoriphagus boritolerans DSM 17298 = JCM 18970 TaxID=1120964 RepID=A0A1H5SSV9_9BACT|nr:TonB-dependent receptor [Algoriphagus boritolerans]SEF53544.1 outer membrane receptor for ferrienterochelin and colicins [Algoriphagus boritolerans DSM 17298 = JCM 18970]